MAGRKREVKNASEPPLAIQIDGDVLIPDSELAAQWGVTTRTLYRYENEPNGLPFWHLGGRKYRAVKESARWLALRACRPNPRPR